MGFSRDELGAQLYDSLHDKLMTLPDSTRVFPAHGAGSACGKNLSTELSSTIGAQRRENYALLAPDRHTFIELVTECQPPAPSYFIHEATLNKQRRELMDETAPPDLMTWDEVRAALADGALLIDGSDPVEFARGHLRGAVNVGLAGRYAEFAGSVVPADADIVLFVEPGAELEAKNRLGRIGFDRVLGHVDRAFEVLRAHPDQAQVASRLTPVGSSVAASLLRANSFDDVSDVVGGFGAWGDVVRSA